MNEQQGAVGEKGEKRFLLNRKKEGKILELGKIKEKTRKRRGIYHSEGRNGGVSSVVRKKRGENRKGGREVVDENIREKEEIGDNSVLGGGKKDLLAQVKVVKNSTSGRGEGKNAYIGGDRWKRGKGSGGNCWKRMSRAI